MVATTEQLDLISQTTAARMLRSSPSNVLARAMRNGVEPATMVDGRTPVFHRHDIVKLAQRLGIQEAA